MTSIIPVPSGRTSDYLLSQRLTNQMSATQLDLLRLQTQITTGRRVLSLSDDAPAAIRGVTLQSLLEQKTQIQTNLTTSQSYLAATDVALANAANTLNDMNGLAVRLSDTTFSDSELAAAGEQVERAIQQMMDLANQQFRGRYLFSGSNTTTIPFQELDNGLIQYAGNTTGLSSFADIDLLFDTTVNGDDAFGAISQEFKGLNDLNPVVTESTKLSDLRGGKGIEKGSFQISDGISPPVTIDISKANTLADVARLIEANPPAGRKVTARISDTGLIVDIDDAGGGNLTIRELGGSRVAAQLGILDTDGNLTNPIIGTDLNPRITLTTKVDNLLGTRANSVIEYPGANNDILIKAHENGESLNGVKLQLVDDNLLKAGSGISRGNEIVNRGTDLLRSQATLNFSGADNNLLLTANTTDGSLDGVRIVVDASNDLGDSAVIGPTTLVNGVPTITVQIDDSDETTLQSLANAFATDGRFAIGSDSASGEGFDPAATIASTNDGLTSTTNVTTQAVKARASLPLIGGGNDLTLVANQAGDQFNNVEIVIDASGDIGDAATASYSDDGTTRRLTIQIDDTSETTLQSVINAIAAEGTFSVTYDNGNGESFNLASAVPYTSAGTVGNTGNTGGDADSYYVQVASGTTTADDLLRALNNHTEFSADFTATIDPKDTTAEFLSASGTVSTSVIGETTGGSGVVFDRDSGVQIQNGTETTVLTFDNVETVEDLLNVFNRSGAGLVAEINSSGNGINVRSNISGGDFSIGENGGDTATQLGLRSFNSNTVLSELNFGRGVQGTDGTDLTITRNDGVELEIDLSTAKTVGDVLNLINNHPQNLDGTNAIVARLSEYGNGIELIDDNPDGFGRLKVSQGVLSTAGTDLGLIPPGETEATVSDSPDAQPATATVRFDAPNDANNAFKLTANAPGTSYNNIQVEFVNSAASGNQAFVTFDQATQKLTIDVDPTLTSANTVISAIKAEGTFNAELFSSEDATNSGAGLITQTGVLATTNGGTPLADSASATADVTFSAPDNHNTAFTLVAKDAGTLRNGVKIILDDSLPSGGVPSATFAPGANTLTVKIEAGVTTANQVIAAIDQDGNFDAKLLFTNDATNDGSGVINTTGTVGTTSGGTAEVLSGRNVNALETKGIFNSLLRLKDAIASKDVAEISRVAGLMGEDIQRLSFTRGELGARDQHVDVLKARGEDEILELKSNLSQEIDVDMIQAITDMTAKQASFQASLKTAGQLYQLTLLDYI
ncbi:flagellar hook-associated protein FlgL [Blastopirellula marina]|uniref:Flagellar hook-associated protein 3 n=1 Tax=Blastopirellula marina TaxID=124 RepID=A0A2S8FNJ1_9BACT|nr:flagellar hook-associated protein FlgL [Blastopirellula marina]PQO33762.1 flagellar hook-associated protein 3 [Blastopirellula marina]PTL43549.1 flagellar hook-associated protein 3 [Blastopirellula marina]